MSGLAANTPLLIWHLWLCLLQQARTTNVKENQC